MSYEPPSPRRARRPLGKLSARRPPAIARPEIGPPLGLGEFRPAYEAIERVACDAYAAAVAKGVDPEMAIGRALTAVGSEQSKHFAGLSSEGIPRSTDPDVHSWLEVRGRRGLETCALAAMLVVLAVWPEAEPGSLLLDVAREPPDGSTRLVLAAVAAMGATGRLDYAPALDEMLRPGVDERLVWNAVAAYASITGDATPALRVVDSTFPFGEETAAGLPGALLAAEGSAADRAIEGLLGSSDFLRRRAGLKTVRSGPPNPELRSVMFAAARAPDLDRKDAMLAVDAIVNQEGDHASLLLDRLARDAPSANLRAIALTRLSAPSRDLAVEIAEAGPDPDLAIALARRAAAEGGDGARVLEAFGGEETRRLALLEAIARTEDPMLEEMSARLWTR